MRRVAPAAQRNSAPIAEVLAGVVGDGGVVLEIASGTGQHAAFFAARFPKLDWQPSDGDPDALPSIEAWRADSDLANLRAPLHLDVCAEAWWAQVPEAPAMLLCINMIHIAPWRACEGLMAGAAALLPAGAALVTYGPYLVSGRDTAPSNLAFDASLRARDPSWGVRELDAVAAEAAANGLRLERTVDMPANNLTCVFRRE